MRGAATRMLIGGLVVGGAVLAPAVAAAAPAEDPVDLQGAYVLDLSGVVDDPGSVQDALDALYDERGTQLFVVYAESFEGAADDQAWANESAERSGLGDRDVLLAIATRDRAVRWSVADAFPVSDANLQDIYDDRVVPELKAGDWGGGAIAFAQGLSDAQASSLALPIAGGVVLVGGAAAGTIALVRRRRARKATEDAVQADRAELDRRAGRLLVELDDSLKTSEQELGFAQAQFGEDQTRDFAAALAEARTTAKQAFELRQKLDDAFPETPEQHRTMTLRLIELAEQADATLDAQADAFDALRELERNAPQVLDQVAATQQGLSDRISAAETRITELAASYPKADLTTFRGVPAQARKLTGFAATAVEDARAELAKPKGEAAVAVRAAQQAAGQVEQLLAGVEALAANLAEQAEQGRKAAADLDAALQTARAGVSAAQDYITTHRGAVATTARTRISEAQRHLDTAAGLAATDAVQALREAQDAQRLAGQALASARTDVESFQQQAAVRDYGRTSPEDRHRYEEADGASLGGILSDLFFGGSPGGSSGGWSWGGGSGSSWSSSRPSGFGGSSRRSSSSSRRSSGSSRRSSSSRSSGGGRRGGGGRF